MNLHLTDTGTVFALLLAFYVFLHCALTIGEIRRTEKASFRLLEGTETYSTCTPVRFWASTGSSVSPKPPYPMYSGVQMVNQ